MHEMSFAAQILENVVREAEPYSGATVVRIKLRAGQALALEPASLRFCLEAISVGTIVEGAAIEMYETGPELECPSCGRVTIESIIDPVCPRCGQQGRLALATELIIEEIELDEQDGEARDEGEGQGA